MRARSLRFRGLTVCIMITEGLREDSEPYASQRVTFSANTLRSIHFGTCFKFQLDPSLSPFKDLPLCQLIFLLSEDTLIE